MNKMVKLAKELGSVTYDESWKWCVSISSSYASTNWREFFFTDHTAARKFDAAARKEGWAALIVDQEGY